jgi:diketogulonate reductase-like aldo/keto reductase
VSDQRRSVTLNNGVHMPILGFGVFQIPPDQTEQAVTDALAAGCRHLDTAESYRNEAAVGRAIATSGIPRDESWGPVAEGRNHLFSDPTLSQVGAAPHKSVAQVVLRWLIQRQVVVIPTSVRPERMAEHLDVLDVQLSDEEMGRIATLDTGASLFFDHRDPAVVSQIGNRRT